LPSFLRASFVLAAALTLASACTENAHGPLAGASDAWARTSKAATTPAPSPASVWDEYATVLHWPVANPAPFASQGHLPQQVDVRVNEAAAASYAALVTDTVFPEGTTLAELSHAGSGRGYIMRKIAHKWSYLELEADGRVLASGALTLCAGCHAQAPADQVFGLPHTP